MMLLPILASVALGTGGDLLAACTAPETDRALCSAMVMGVANGAMLAGQEAHQQILCPRIGMRPADLVEAVRKYIDAHPEDRSKPAAVLTFRALKEALPCVRH